MGALPASAAAVLAAAALVLAGCGDDTPPPTPSSSSAPTSASPTTQSPTPQPESAEEFIRRWAEAGTAMQNSGKTEGFATLNWACEPCDTLQRLVTKYYRAGGFVVTDGWTIRSIADAPSPEPSHPIFVVSVDSAPTRYRESATGPITRLAGGPAKFRFSLTKRGGDWRVTDFIEVSQ